MDELGELAIGLIIVVSLFGIMVPILPGLAMEIVAVFVWAALTGGAVAWSVAIAALLIGVSERLVAGGETVSASHTAPLQRMRALVDFHVDFALGNADVIRVQDRDLAHLSPEAHSDVRRLQRAYIELWIAGLDELVSAPRDELRLRVQACFGLLNSTPHSTSAAIRSRRDTAELLTAMALAALLTPAG